MENTKQTVSAKTSENLRKRIKSYAENQGMGQSDAVRDLWRKGLKSAELEEKCRELENENQQLKTEIAARDDRTTVRNVGTVAGAAVIASYYFAGTASFVGAAVAIWMILWGWWPSLRPNTTEE